MMNDNTIPQELSSKYLVTDRKDIDVTSIFYTWFHQDVKFFFFLVLGCSFYSNENDENIKMKLQIRNHCITIHHLKDSKRRKLNRKQT